MTETYLPVPGRRQPHVPSTVMARGLPETVELSECYVYEQEVSRNAYLRQAENPTGRIRITVPYDGERYFSRQALADVAIQSAAGDGRGSQALIGHLLLAGHERTDLRERLRLNDRFGGVPILVPLPGPEAGGADRLTADDSACVLEIDYRPSPGHPREIPLDLDVQLLDPDGTDSLSNDIERFIVAGNAADLYRSDVVAQIRRQASFRPHLLLVVRVLVNLPAWAQPAEGRTPIVRTVSLDWPTVTSLRSLSLDMADTHRPVSYNPAARSLEWGDVPLRRLDPGATHRDTLSYASPEMLLLVKQPGELYQQPSLDGWVEVEVPGVLLSGTGVRLFDALGNPARHQPDLITRVRTNLHLVLDDAFARRTLSPVHHLHFDEVIPDEPRIADVVAALSDRGFDVEAPRSPDSSERILYATRHEGPDVMKLLLYIAGEEYKTQRTSKVTEGHEYISIMGSGELNIYIRGELPRDSRGLTREMNALQSSLREKFFHHRTRR